MYSNHGLGIAGHVIHAVAGMPYIDFMQDYVFGPIDVSATHTHTYYEDLTSLDAKRYSQFTSGMPYSNSSFDSSRVYGAYGIKRGDLGTAAGGWVLSARDLVRVMCATDQLANVPDLLAIIANTNASTTDLKAVANQVADAIAGAGIPFNYDLFGTSMIEGAP